MNVVAVMSVFIHTRKMLALWFLLAHHLQREQDKHKIRTHIPAQSDHSKYTFRVTKELN